MSNNLAEINSPVADSQKWINQIGYEGSFQKPDSASLLRHLLIGGVTGLTAGTLSDKNMWSPAWRTTAGTLAGHLLGSALSDKANKETNSALGALLGGGAGLAYSLHKKYKSKPTELTLPGLKLTAKTASFQEILDKIKGQLPNFRLPDTLVGAGTGAGAGWLYDKLKSDEGLSEKEKSKNKWRRILGGAGLGTLAANLAGDRARRYISNTIIPFGYGNPGISNPSALMSKPTASKIWHGAILDQPLQPGVSNYLEGDYNAKAPDYDVKNLAARRELIRIGMGVGNQDQNSIWKKQPDSTYSINPQHKDSNNILKSFFFPNTTSPGTEKETEELQKKLVFDPQASIADINAVPGDFNQGLMTPISGGQRVPLFPYISKEDPDQIDYLGRFLKKFNVDVRPEEKEKAIKYLKEKYLYHKPDAVIEDLNKYQDETGSDEQVKTLGKRWVLEHLVMKNSPWVSQRMYFKHMPPINSPLYHKPITHSYAAIPSTASGELYPGNSVLSANLAKGRDPGKPTFNTIQDVLNFAANNQPTIEKE
jgi:uncharacterized membrane protein YebE (DUF533 family)